MNAENGTADTGFLLFFVICSRDPCTQVSGMLNLPAQLQTISANAFQNCAGFTGALTIPANVRTIGASAFDGCDGLGAISVPGTSLNTTGTPIGTNAFRRTTAGPGLTLPTRFSPQTFGYVGPVSYL